MAQFTIRIPDEMRDRIKEAAEEDRRSMNSEIGWLLDCSLASRDIGVVRGFDDGQLQDCYAAASREPGSEWHSILLAEMYRRDLFVEGPA